LRTRRDKADPTRFGERLEGEPAGQQPGPDGLGEGHRLRVVAVDADGPDALVADQPLDLPAGLVRVVDEGVVLGPRHQRPVRPIPPVGEPLWDERDDPLGLGREHRPRQPDDR
jgi:hypothetical protein